MYEYRWPMEICNNVARRLFTFSLDPSYVWIRPVPLCTGENLYLFVVYRAIAITVSVPNWATAGPKIISYSNLMCEMNCGKIYIQTAAY